MNLAILISGTGSNLKAIAAAIENHQLNARIACVISNEPHAPGLAWANQQNFSTAVLSHHAFSSREDFDAELHNLLKKQALDCIALAGFMRRLTSDFVKEYSGRLLNIHPSLLPKYPGLHTHHTVLKAKESEHGTTVHYVNEVLDGGPIVAQVKFPITGDESAEELKIRVQAEEHVLYPKVLQWKATGRLQYKDNRVILNGHVLPKAGIELPASRQPLLFH